ncbi:MAG: DNA mismatch endonuclease Vsr [Actinophytocola sp.]|uniref:very short patch repair endonuclease n=1 Tax=Actinophytocola sp. TaxID=1872138 RepID=UPI001327A667|nr:very short patch repair endonuclease [Actinophytocola sp.]MPZ84010.1 DNA mismatch endonuclease Vsr [Actinophytocola sp.]
MTPTSGISPDRDTSRADRPPASSPGARRRMQAAHRRDTAPELALRRELHRRGFRYRVDFAPLPGLRRRADLVFPRKRLAVYVDGCFWHSCPEHATQPKSNAAWWADKLATNQRRDRDTDQRLRENGWIVVRVWEHENAVAAADRIETILRLR